jgi:hypothetical protein
MFEVISHQYEMQKNNKIDKRQNFRLGYKLIFPSKVYLKLKLIEYNKKTNLPRTHTFSDCFQKEELV